MSDITTEEIKDAVKTLQQKGEDLYIAQAFTSKDKTVMKQWVGTPYGIVVVTNGLASGHRKGLEWLKDKLKKHE